MLNSIKTYISEIPDVPFDEFYQRYICYVQDMNIISEINNMKSDDIISLNKLISRLKN